MIDFVNIVYPKYGVQTGRFSILDFYFIRFSEPDFIISNRFEINGKLIFDIFR